MLAVSPLWFVGDSMATQTNTTKRLLREILMLRDLNGSSNIIGFRGGRAEEQEGGEGREEGAANGEVVTPAILMS